MAFKPNYNFQRSERDRAKQAKKEAKLRERQDAAASKRRDEQPGDSDAPPQAQDTPQE